MLSKIRHYVSFSTLKSVYFSIFSSVMSYGSQIWGQAQTANIRKISTLQNKAIRLINFTSIDEHADPFYKMCNILRLSDTVNLQNFLYVYDHHHNNLPKALSNTYKSIKDAHSQLIRGS